MRRSSAAALFLAMASGLRAASALAGPCGWEVGELRRSLPRDETGDRSFVGTAPQSIAAQLEHQPTRQSVENAKRNARAHIMIVLARAEAFDASGRPNECRDALLRARLLLNP